MRRGVVVALAALVQLAVWLLTMGHTAADWTAGGSAATWLVLEAVVAVLVGAVATGPGPAACAVGAGWLLQAVHFAAGTTKDEEHNLWAVGVILQACLAAGAVGLALLTWQVTHRARRRADR